MPNRIAAITDGYSEWHDGVRDALSHYRQNQRVRPAIYMDGE